MAPRVSLLLRFVTAIAVLPLAACGAHGSSSAAPSHSATAPATASPSAAPATDTPSPSASPGPALALALSGQLHAEVTTASAGKYDDDSSVLGCGPVNENPGHPSYLATWRSTVAGTTYLFYINIANYQGQGSYPFSSGGNYMLLRDPASAAAPPLFYPAARVDNNGSFIDNKGIVTITGAKSGTVTAQLSNAQDFNEALGGPTPPQVDLTVSGTWVCP